MKNYQIKKLSILLVLVTALCSCRTTSLTQKEEKLHATVTDFGTALRAWSENKTNGEYEVDIDNYAREKAPVNCDLIVNLAEKYPIVIDNDTIDKYDIEDYMDMLYDWFEDNQKVIVDLKDIKKMPDSEMAEQKIDKTLKENYIVFKGDLTLKNKSGKYLTLDSVTHKEVYYVSLNKSKIAKIEPQITVDGKVRIDWSNLEEEQTVGGTLNWSPNWYGFTFSYSWPFFMANFDLGFNTDKDKVTQEKLAMTNVLNYTKETITYDPYLYLTVTPAVYLKYVAIGCGVGCMLSDKTITGTKASASYTGNEASNISKTSLKPYQEEPMEPDISFMLRPTVKGFIPLNDEWFLTASVNYDWSFGVRIKNGMSFGLGLQYRLY